MPGCSLATDHAVGVAVMLSSSGDVEGLEGPWLKPTLISESWEGRAVHLGMPWKLRVLCATGGEVRSESAVETVLCLRKMASTQKLHCCTEGRDDRTKG